MTKHVRIENADAGTDYSVVVESWEGDPEGEKVLRDKTMLRHPTDMTGYGRNFAYIASGMWLVVREATEHELANYDLDPTAW